MRTKIYVEKKRNRPRWIRLDLLGICSSILSVAISIFISTLILPIPLFLWPKTVTGELAHIPGWHVLLLFFLLLVEILLVSFCFVRLLILINKRYAGT
mgnify:CR=1